jgi:NAD(P)-dependent dehydrogenase (short-subunit alcohol dehydrogenase family)
MSNHAIINWAKSFSTTFSLRELQAQWAEIMGINFNSVIMVAQAFAPSMSQQKSDSVIITSGSKLGVDNRP